MIGVNLYQSHLNLNVVPYQEHYYEFLYQLVPLLIY